MAVLLLLALQQLAELRLLTQVLLLLPSLWHTITVLVMQLCSEVSCITLQQVGV